MPTRRKFRRNNRKSRRRNKRGGDGDPTDPTDPPWFKGGDKSYEEILKTPTTTQLNPEKVADYYYNKAMTQVYEINNKKMLAKKILIRTPKSMFEGMSTALEKRAKKAAANEFGQKMNNEGMDQETLDDIGKYIWFSKELEYIRENSEWKKDKANMKFGLDGMAGLGNSALLLEVCLMMIAKMKKERDFKDGYHLKDKRIQRLWKKEHDEGQTWEQIEWGNVYKYIEEGIKDLDDTALFGGNQYTDAIGPYRNGVMFNLLNELSYKCVRYVERNGGYCATNKIVGKEYNPSKYPKGRYAFYYTKKQKMDEDDEADNKNYMKGTEDLYKKIIKLFVVKFNNKKSGGRKRKRTRRKRRKKRKKSRRRRRR